MGLGRNSKFLDREEEASGVVGMSCGESSSFLIDSGSSFTCSVVVGVCGRLFPIGESNVSWRGGLFSSAVCNILEDFTDGNEHGLWRFSFLGGDGLLVAVIGVT